MGAWATLGSALTSYGKQRLKGTQGKSAQAAQGKDDGGGAIGLVSKGVKALGKRRQRKSLGKSDGGS